MSAKASCYQCYKLFWSGKRFEVPEGSRSEELAVIAKEPFCSEMCWVKAESKAKVSEAKKARAERERERLQSAGKDR